MYKKRLNPTAFSHLVFLRFSVVTKVPFLGKQHFCETEFHIASPTPKVEFEREE